MIWYDMIWYDIMEINTSAFKYITTRNFISKMALAKDVKCTKDQLSKSSLWKLSVNRVANGVKITISDNRNTGNEDNHIADINKFLNIYLRMFHCCFIKKHTNCKAISKPWLTNGIQTSCNRKRELYLKMRDSNEMKHKLYYKQYCKILTEVIKEAKKLHYKEAISKSKKN